MDLSLSLTLGNPNLRKVGGTAAAYSHTMASFNGTTYLSRASLPAYLGTARYMTAAFKVNQASVAGTLRNLLWFSNTARLGVFSLFQPVLSLATAFPTTFSGQSGTTMTANTDYTCHVAVDFVGGTFVFNLNGASDTGTLVIGGAGNSANWSNGSTNAGIMASGAGASAFTASIGFLWFAIGDTAGSHYITDATKFYNAGDVDLGTDGTGSGLAQPQMFWGGRNGPSHWNAGVNAGSGGETWTVNGTVT